MFERCLCLRDVCIERDVCIVKYLCITNMRVLRRHLFSRDVCIREILALHCKKLLRDVVVVFCCSHCSMLFSIVEPKLARNQV